MAIFDDKTGDFLRYLTTICPPSGVRAIFLVTFLPDSFCGKVKNRKSLGQSARRVSSDL